MITDDPHSTCNHRGPMGGGQEDQSKEVMTEAAAGVPVAGCARLGEALSHRVQAASGNWQRPGNRFPPSTPRRAHSAADTLILAS